MISTDRLGGIFQEAITVSSEKLGKGDWVRYSRFFVRPRVEAVEADVGLKVHVFPEGKVSQPSLNPHYEDGMFRFRWGVYVQRRYRFHCTC